MEHTTTLQEKRLEAERKILEAAKSVFAELGFAGARVDEIARRAGVNKAMIYYRIGDKEALYAQVLHHVFSDLAARITTRIKNNLSPENKLKAYIREVVSTVEQHPYMPPIMMRELASGGENFPALAVSDLATVLGYLQKILTEGQEKGQFHNTTPFPFHLMVVSALVSSKNIENIIKRHDSILRNHDALGHYFHENMVEEVTEILLRAIKK